MSRMAGIAIAALVASAAMNVVLYKRQQSLETRVGQLECRPAPAAAQRAPDPAAGTERPVAPVPEAGPADAPGAGPGSGRATPPAPGAQAAATGYPADGAPIPETLRAAIAREVDRAVKQKLPVAEILGPAEQLDALSRELNLSEAQRLRVKEIWKLRDDEMSKLVEESDGIPGPRKFVEIQERYNALVRNELDSIQQTKFDEMKKNGTLPAGGLSVRIEHRVDGEPPADQ